MSQQLELGVFKSKSIQIKTTTQYNRTKPNFIRWTFSENLSDRILILTFHTNKNRYA